MSSRVDIEVVADWVGLPGPTPMGVLSAEVVRNRETYRFAYDEAWLGAQPLLQLDPRLQLVSGPQYPPAKQTTFGLFLDSGGSSSSSASPTSMITFGTMRFCWRRTGGGSLPPTT